MFPSFVFRGAALSLFGAFALLGCAGKQSPGAKMPALAPGASTAGLYWLQTDPLSDQVSQAMRAGGSSPRGIKAALGQLGKGKILLLWDEAEDPIGFHVGVGDASGIPLRLTRAPSHFELRLRDAPQAMEARCSAQGMSSMECHATLQALPGAELTATLKRCGAPQDGTASVWYEAEQYDEKEKTAFMGELVRKLEAGTEGRMPTAQRERVAQRQSSDPLRMTVCGDEAIILGLTLIQNATQPWPFLAKSVVGTCPIQGATASCNLVFPREGVVKKLACQLGPRSMECQEDASPRTYRFFRR